MSVTVPINPEVLRWARESVEISVGEAAARIKEEESVIVAWEAGTAQPTVTIRLLDVAGAPSDARTMRTKRPMERR